MTAVNLPSFGSTEVLGQTRMNALRDAVDALANPPSAIYDRPTTDPILTTNSASFVAVENTTGKYNLTIVTAGNPVLLSFNAALTHNTLNAYGYIDFEIDGTLLVGAGTVGAALHQFVAANTDYWLLSYQRMITGLGAGSHTFKVFWRTSAGIVSLNPATRSQFFVREL